MQNLIYNNLNSRFTFNTILSLLTKFWINEVINKKVYSKIWLTITVYNSHNKSFTLINNLPFNINNYTDILIVIKQVFNTSFFNDRDILNTIVFKYHLETKNNYKRDLYITNILIFISIIIIILLLLLCIFIIYLETYSLYNIEYLDTEILNYANENLKNANYKESTISKRFIFSPFVELFNGSTNVSSNFVDKNFNYFYVLNYLGHCTDIQINSHSTILSESIFKLYTQIEDYESLVSELLEDIHKHQALINNAKTLEN